MKTLLYTLALLIAPSLALADAVRVTPDNFCRAESDLYFSGVVATEGFGKWKHTRVPAPLDEQTVIRLNRDTIYSSAVFDLDAGPVTITLPDAGERFVSLQIITQDHYVHGVYYEPGEVELVRQDVGTRYVVAAVRTLVDPNDPADVAAANALQDQIMIDQDAIGVFELPEWDAASQNLIRSALLQMATTLPDSLDMYGAPDEVDPVRHLIGCALGWGANPASEALYLNLVPAMNDGDKVYRLSVKNADVPVKGFWSISVYNAEGYFEPNELDRYSLNSITAVEDANDVINVQFGACEQDTPNCLPTPVDWNYMVRLYQPSRALLNGEWTFPAAELVE